MPLTKGISGGYLYDSLNNRIKPPARQRHRLPGPRRRQRVRQEHEQETFDTLGHQKRVNYALLATTGSSS